MSGNGKTPYLQQINGCKKQNKKLTRKYPLRGYILSVLTHTTALDQLWGGDGTLTMWFLNWVYAPWLRLGGSSLTWHLELLPSGLKIECTNLGSPLAGAVWLRIWNSDHVVLKLIIRTSASPRQQWSNWGVRVIQNAYFSLLSHTKQLFLVTFWDKTAENWASFRTHRRTDGRMDRRTWKLFRFDKLTNVGKMLLLGISLLKTQLSWDAFLVNMTFGNSLWFRGQNSPQLPVTHY